MKTLRAAKATNSEWWIGKRLLVISAVCFAGAILSFHYLTKARSGGDMNAAGQWALLVVIFYIAGMACVVFPLARRARESYKTAKALKRAREEAIELQRKFERKRTTRRAEASRSTRRS